MATSVEARYDIAVGAVAAKMRWGLVLRIVR